MTPAELIDFAKARYGKGWKTAMADETGWSYWTFHRIEREQSGVSKKLAKAVESLAEKARRP